MADIYGPNPTPDCFEEMARGTISLTHRVIRTAIEEMRIAERVMHLARTVGLCAGYITPKPDRLPSDDAKLQEMRAKILSDLDASSQKFVQIWGNMFAATRALDSLAPFITPDNEELEVLGREYGEAADWLRDTVLRFEDLEPRLKEGYELMERLNKELRSTEVIAQN